MAAGGGCPPGDGHGCMVYVCRISDINFLEIFLEKSIDIFLEKWHCNIRNKKTNNTK